MYQAVGESSGIIYFVAESLELVHQGLLKKYPSFKVNKKDIYDGRQSQITKVFPEAIRIKKDQQGRTS